MRRLQVIFHKAKMPCKMIGLIGTCSGAGTTHLGVTLANYYANGLHRKVAVVGVGSTKDYELIKEELDTKGVRYYKERSGKYAFSYKGIDFFTKSCDGMTSMLRDSYDTIIVDLNLRGTDSHMIAALREVSECEKKILVGSFLPWKCKECLKRVERIGKIIDLNGMTMLTTTISPKRVRQVEHEYNIKVRQVPMETNPFKISGEHLEFLRSL